MWLTITFAVVVSLLIGIICGGIVLPDDYRHIKDDTPLTPENYKEEETELFAYMKHNGFEPPEDMRQFIKDNDLVMWKGVIYRNVAKEPEYFVVDYVPKADACKRWNGEFCCCEIVCSLVFSFETKKCVAARWLEKDGKEYKKKYYQGKPA